MKRFNEGRVSGRRGKNTREGGIHRTPSHKPAHGGTKRSHRPETLPGYESGRKTRHTACTREKENNYLSKTRTEPPDLYNLADLTITPHNPHSMVERKIQTLWGKKRTLRPGIKHPTYKVDQKNGNVESHRIRNEKKGQKLAGTM